MMSEKGKQSTADRYIEVSFILETERWHIAQQNISQCPTADGGNNTQNQNSQQIHFPMDSSQGAGYSEGRSTDKIKNIEQIHSVSLWCIININTD
jgi:hypothetical protein